MNEIPLFDEPTPKRPREETSNSNMSNLIGSSSVLSIIRSSSFLACSDPITDRELQTFVFEKYYFYFTDKVGMFHQWIGVSPCWVLELSKRAMLWCLGVFEGRRKASKNILTWSLSKETNFFTSSYRQKKTLKGKWVIRCKITNHPFFRQEDQGMCIDGKGKGDGFDCYLKEVI